MGAGENLDVTLGVAMAVLPGVGLLSLVWLVGLYALAVGVGRRRADRASLKVAWAAKGARTAG